MMENEAATALREVERVRRSTRDFLDMSWVPFLVFGVAVLGSAPFTQIGDGVAAGLYWLVAGPVGLALTWRYFRGREIAVGLVDRNEYLYAAVLAAMVGGAIGIGWLAGGIVSDVGPLYPIAGGLLALGLIRRSALVGGSGLALAAWATAVIVADPGEAELIAVIGEGLLLVAAGFAALGVARSRGSLDREAAELPAR